MTGSTAETRRRPYGRKWDGPQGSVRRILIQSKAFSGNMLGDPDTRAVDIYLPPGRSDGAGLALLVCLAGFGKSGLSYTAWRGDAETLPERLDRLIGSGAMAPVCVVFPDCYSRLGGSQYVNSPVFGRVEDFLVSEMLPEIERRTGAGGAGRRGIFGHSSGGYGALWHGVHHAATWSAVAARAPDIAFELAYLPDWPGKLTMLSRYESIPQFLDSVDQNTRPGWPELHLCMLLAMAGFYDPAPAAPLGLRLPLDPHTAELIPDRWANWLRHDPLNLDLKKMSALKGLWLEVGTRDRYHLQYGCRRLARKLEAAGVAHRYE
jgi:hypothetical protein